MIGVYVSTFSNYDATCNDAVSMCQILIRLGYEVKLISMDFVDECNRVPSLDLTEGLNAVDNSESVMIYHYGVYDPNYERISALKCKKLFRYHNITEPKYFVGYDSVAEDICGRGREQIKDTLGGFDGYWSNSFYTASELVDDCGLSPEDSKVLYPFHNIEDRLNGGIRHFRDIQEKQEIHLLNVGRICPHKNQIFLLKCFKELISESGLNFKLNLVGKIGPQKYWDEFMEELSNSGVEEQVNLFTNGVSEEDLQKQYMNADIFCCASRHEGYCVPVIEAMSFSLPVISTSDTALKDTISSFGLLVESNNTLQFKHAIMRVTERGRGNVYNTLSRLSYQGYERMTTAINEKVFVKYLQKILIH